MLTIYLSGADSFAHVSEMGPDATRRDVAHPAESSRQIQALVQGAFGGSAVQQKLTDVLLALRESDVQGAFAGARDASSAQFPADPSFRCP